MSVGAKDLAATFLALEGNADSLFGYAEEARRKASETLALSNEPDNRAFAAAVLASIGDVQKSAAIVAAVERDAPDNHFIQAVAIPQAKAIQQIQKNQLTEAISTLEGLRPYEFGTGPRGAGVTSIFLRGETYLKMRDGAKAAAEFQRILDHPGAAGFAPEYPLARLNLARAYAMQGDTAKAKTTYQDFFAAWKDADPDVPILKTAKAEYEKLK